MTIVQVRNRHRRAVLLSTCGAVAIFSLPSFALAQAVEPQATQLDEVVVTGIRRSIQTALETKRDANQVVDAITAEDVGKLPDPTVADALQRVPGVQITKNFGQGSRVVIRGLQSNRIEVDGRASYGWPLESANGFGDNVGRNFGMESFSSGLFSKIEVFKTPVASQIEGGLGGVINGTTYHASDFSKPTTVVALEGSRGSKAKGVGYSGTGFFARKVLDNRLGFLVGGTYSNDPVFLTGLTRGGWNESSLVLDQNGDGKRDIRPGGIRSEQFTNVKRRRVGVTGNLQYQINDQLQAYADTTYTDLKINRELLIGIFGIPGGLPINDAVFDGNYVVAGTVNVPFNTQSNYRGEEVSTRTSAIGAKWQTVDTKLRAEYSTTGGIFRQINNLADTPTLAPTSLSFDFRTGDFPKVKLSLADYATIASPTSFGAIGASGGAVQHLRVESQEKAFRVDGERYFDGVLSSVEAGFRYSDLWQERNQYKKAIGAVNPNSAGTLTNIGAAGVVTPQAAAVANLFLNPQSEYFPGFPTGFAVLDLKAIRGESAAIFTSQPLLYDPSQFFHTSEKTYAGYLVANIKSQLGSMPLRGNVGVRVIKTQSEASAIAFTVNAGVLSQKPVSYQSDYTDVLPSANFALNLTDSLIWRAAASKVLARQALDQNGLAPNLVVSINATNPAASTATAGNPFLEPTRLTNFDTTLEWYFSKTGFIAANVFMKDVSGFPVKVTRNTVVPGLDSLGPIDYTTPVNSDSGKIKGFELSYQHSLDFLPGWMRGLGVISSFTYMDAKTDLTYASGKTRYPLKNLPLTGVSKTAYNVTGFYELDGFNVRLSYVWRDKRLYGLQSQGNGVNGAFDASNTGIRYQYIKDAGSLDASVSYDVTPSLNVYLNAANLLPKQSAPVYFTEQEKYQWRHDIGETRFTLGLRAKF